MNHDEYTIEMFRKELITAERFGFMAVRDTTEAALEKWKTDYSLLAEIAYFLLTRANCADVKKDQEMTATYLFLINQTWVYAKEHLSQGDYHAFCSYGKDRTNQTLYSDILIEIYDMYGPI